MPSLDSLERKFGRLAIPYLIPAIALLQLLNFFLLDANPKFIGFLVYIPAKILEGEVWRLVTWPLVPPRAGLLSAILGAIIYIWIGRTLQERWGAFQSTVFVLSTIAIVNVVGLIAAFAYPDLMPVPIPSLSLFFAGAIMAAFAFLFPDEIINFMLVIPIKVRWFGILAAVLAVYKMVITPPLAPHILACWSGFFIFVAPEALKLFRQQAGATIRRNKFKNAATSSSDEAFHTCTTCGTTDITAPETEFRIAPDGEEYCASCLEKKGAN